MADLRRTFVGFGGVDVSRFNGIVGAVEAGVRRVGGHTPR
jgi:hypothetical protein